MKFIFALVSLVGFASADTRVLKRQCSLEIKPKPTCSVPKPYAKDFDFVPKVFKIPLCLIPSGGILVFSEIIFQTNFTISNCSVSEKY
jgi:hypothetical protein